MRQLLELTKRAAAALPGGAAAAAPRADGAPETPEPKTPPGLPLAFMLSHLEDEGPVRLDRVRVSICEVLGLELDEPKLGAFAGALNACDFAVQPLVRQHPPGPGKLTAVGVVELDSSHRRQSQVLPLIELTNRAARVASCLRKLARLAPTSLCRRLRRPPPSPCAAVSFVPARHSTAPASRCR